MSATTTQPGKAIYCAARILASASDEVRGLMETACKKLTTAGPPTVNFNNGCPCWLAGRSPNANDLWRDLSFVDSELSRYERHPDHKSLPGGLCFMAHDAVPDDNLLLEQDWVYAGPLGSICTEQDIEKFIVDPVIALLSGKPAAQALGTIQASLICF
jgi:hypothetical protein